MKFKVGDEIVFAGEIGKVVNVSIQKIELTIPSLANLGRPVVRLDTSDAELMKGLRKVTKLDKALQ